MTIQSCTPFPICNQSVVPWPVLIVASWPAYRFLRRQIRWFVIPISTNFPVCCHSYNQKQWSRSRFFFSPLEFPCFIYDPTNVGNLISGSSVFSKSSLYIWKFLVHILLKPSMKDFEHYLTSMWNECNCVVVWTFLALPSFGTGMKTNIFTSCGHCWVFQICWQIECNTLSASSFRILNSSAGIPSLLLALFLVMLPKGYLTSHSRMSGFRWMITP